MKQVLCLMTTLLFLGCSSAGSPKNNDQPPPPPPPEPRNPCNSGYEPVNGICTNINECLTDNGGCHANADCIDIPSTRVCECSDGYYGNGQQCTQSSGSAKVVAGPYHTCALSNDGVLSCWGKNEFGQLGDGTLVDRRKPVLVEGLDGLVVTDVFLGQSHTCALITDGTLRCWGNNEDGQLGDGTTEDRLTPTIATGLSGLTITKVAISNYSVCALASDGSLRCWGYNGDGEVGDGTDEARTTPTLVTALSGLTVTDVSMGYSSTCAVIADGTARCWGQNWYGGLGDGTDDNRLTPTLVTGLAGLTVTKVSAGSFHTCAIISDGSLRCWGNNESGQIGDGTYGGFEGQNVTPTLVSGLSGLVVTDVSLGYGHTCALISDGSLRCWGDNYYGELGDGTTESSLSPKPVVGMSATALSVRESRSCARDATGGIRCWGSNYYGELGIGGNQNTSTPTLVSVPW